MNPRLALWLLALSLAIGFVWLGRWQSQRAVEKQRIVDESSQAVQARRAQSLAKLSLGEGGHAWVAGSGRFLPAPALLLDNQRRDDAVGIRVFRVFRPTGGRALLVDLGWLAMNGARVLPKIDPPPNGEQKLVGLLTPPPASGLALGPAYIDSGQERWLLTRIDLAALSKGLGIELGPRVLRLDPALPMGYARDLNALPNTLSPERHRGYALQWFGLAAATLGFALYLTFRGKRYGPFR